MQSRYDEALPIMAKYTSPETAEKDIQTIKSNLTKESSKEKAKISELFAKNLRLVLTIGIVVAILQQITGINSVFFYAPMIFEQSGIGTDASFVQAILVGLTNLVFTVLAILFIDKLGRKPLLSFGVAGIAISMFLLAYGFSSATYSLSNEEITQLADNIDKEKLREISEQVYYSDVAFKQVLAEKIGKEAVVDHESELIKTGITMNPSLILFAIIAFVASFAISIGPVMWVLFSELFPNRIRGIAISFVGLINSGVSFLVQWIFPWELATFGSATTFLIYGVFAAIGLVFVVRVIPETKGKSLEELETILIKN